MQQSFGRGKSSSRARGVRSALFAFVVLAVSLGVTAGQAHAAVALKVNFQPAGVAVPAGYTADSGAGYDLGRGFGWVRDESLEAPSHVPLDVAPNARDRDAVADQRLDTLIHMQYPPANTAAGAVKTPAAWEAAVPAGPYTVTVAVGDPSHTDSTHRILVEGRVVIAGFTPTAGAMSATAWVVSSRCRSSWVRSRMLAMRAESSRARAVSSGTDRRQARPPGVLPAMCPYRALETTKALL